MKRQLVLIGGAAILMILAACGSSTATGVSNSPAATPPPRLTPTAVPTPTAAPTPTPVPVKPSPTTGAAVTLRSVGNLGPSLVGPDGKTLYVFLGDTRTTSTCNGICAQNWPPVITAGTPRAMASLRQSLLGTTKRASGAVQIIYHGHPLYYFVGDVAPGTTAGEGIDAFGAEWDVINAAGMVITRG